MTGREKQWLALGDSGIVNFGAIEMVRHWTVIRVQGISLGRGEVHLKLFKGAI